MNEEKNQIKPLQRRVKREANGNWSATVFTNDLEPAEAGRYQYKTRSQARKALLSHEIGEAGRLA
jgi:hypothetical protein